jgi:hypothetical protein
MNLAFGIWGGLLPGQRILIAEQRGDDVMAVVGARKLVSGPQDSHHDYEDRQRLRQDERKNALSFYSRIKPYLEAV